MSALFINNETHSTRFVERPQAAMRHAEADELAPSQPYEQMFHITHQAHECVVHQHYDTHYTGLREGL